MAGRVWGDLTEDEQARVTRLLTPDPDDNLDDLLARINRAQEIIEGSGAPVCTGLTAAWCPVHGDCTCPDRGYSDGDLDDPSCPLHAPESDHPRPEPPKCGASGQSDPITGIVREDEVQR